MSNRVKQARLAFDSALVAHVEAYASSKQTSLTEVTETYKNLVATADAYKAAIRSNKADMHPSHEYEMHTSRMTLLEIWEKRRATLNIITKPVN